MMNKNCLAYLIGVIFTFTLLFLWQNASASCTTRRRTVYDVIHVIDGVSYTCSFEVDICKGGCSATMTYDVHVQDLTKNPRRKCSVDAHQCVSVGINYREVTLEDCYFTVNGTQVPQSLTLKEYKAEPTGCNCAVKISGSQSEDECMTNFIYDEFE